jgi:hypothetical protein
MPTRSPKAFCKPAISVLVPVDLGRHRGDDLFLVVAFAERQRAERVHWCGALHKWKIWPPLLSSSAHVALGPSRPCAEMGLSLPVAYCAGVSRSTARIGTRCAMASNAARRRAFSHPCAPLPGSTGAIASEQCSLARRGIQWSTGPPAPSSKALRPQRCWTPWPRLNGSSRPGCDFSRQRDASGRRAKPPSAHASASPRFTNSHSSTSRPPQAEHLSGSECNRVMSLCPPILSSGTSLRRSQAWHCTPSGWPQVAAVWRLLLPLTGVGIWRRPACAKRRDRTVTAGNMVLPCDAGCGMQAAKERG